MSTGISESLAERRIREQTSRQAGGDSTTRAGEGAGETAGVCQRTGTRAGAYTT